MGTCVVYNWPRTQALGREAAGPGPATSTIVFSGSLSVQQTQGGRRPVCDITSDQCQGGIDISAGVKDRSDIILVSLMLFMLYSRCRYGLKMHGMW